MEHCSGRFRIFMRYERGKRMSTRARNYTILAVLGVVAAGLAGCDGLDGFERYREDFHTGHAFGSHGKLEVENTNGSIDIASWDRETLDVSGEKYASSRNELDQVKIDVQVSGGVARVKVSHPTAFLGSYGAKLLIRVPKATVLDRVKTTNGGVTVEDLEGNGNVGTTNGSMRLEHVNGDYEVESTNGSLELNECRGAIRAQTTNGAIRGRLAGGAVEAETTNGSIELTLQHVSPGAAIRAHTNNGGVTLALAEFNANPITVHTTTGSITLRLPEGTGARLEAGNSVSGIVNDLIPFTVEEQSRHRLSGKLGAGGPQIELHTTTGKIRLERY
jgi:hypothetical protein